MNTVYSTPARRGWHRARAGAAMLAAGAIVWTTSAAAALPSDGYADLVEKVSPAVVFISSSHKAAEPNAEMRGRGEMPFPIPPNSPLEEFFKRFGEQMPMPNRPTAALGSGFVIDPAGFIVTNNHVVDGADKVQVKLQDGRKFTANIVGKDAKTDLALLKITAPKKLPYVKFGNSDKLRPGNVVLAVGNPFGLGGTVTAGIVSARNRDINAGPYDDFIQTDAAVNQGNSGGPLFDTDGNVVGVNTAIYSPNGGSVGIGFAIPANLAKDVIAQLKDHGNVERGWLGVKIQAITPEIAQAVGLDSVKGALIADVTSDSPAEKAGLRQGDVVLAYNGKDIKTMRDLPGLVAATRAGETATVELLRDGSRKSVPVTIGRLKSESRVSAGDGSIMPDGASSGFIGAELAMLDDASRTRLNLPENQKGVVIARIQPEGRAAAAGLRPGDVIERVGSTPVASPADVEKAIEQSNENAVLLMVSRGGDTLFIGMRRADT